MTDPRTPSKVSIIQAEALEKYIPPEGGMRYVQWKGLTLTVRTMITFREMVELVEGVAASCRDSRDGSVHPACMEAALRDAVLMRYAFVETPEDVEARMRLLFGTSLYETVCAAVNGEQLEAIKSAVRMCLRM